MGLWTLRFSPGIWNWTLGPIWTLGLNRGIFPDPQTSLDPGAEALDSSGPSDSTGPWDSPWDSPWIRRCDKTQSAVRSRCF